MTSTGPGIIPARAGFTPTAPGAATCGWDHPRSRGVYLDLPRADGPTLGSSPLARGLHDPQPVLVLDHGIIPARAGFTTLRDRTGCVSRDHPRSRGVYPRRTGARRSTRGSSPLARGLLPTPTIPRATQRIIPARAGFTVSWRRPTIRTSDHPRSRGVYMNAKPYNTDVAGIIPARAGFTRKTDRESGLSSDHPRSRGVYG